MPKSTSGRTALKTSALENTRDEVRDSGGSMIHRCSYIQTVNQLNVNDVIGTLWRKVGLRNHGDRLIRAGEKESADPYSECGHEANAAESAKNSIIVVGPGLRGAAKLLQLTSQITVNCLFFQYD